MTGYCSVCGKGLLIDSVFHSPKIWGRSPLLQGRVFWCLAGGGWFATPTTWETLSWLWPGPYPVVSSLIFHTSCNQTPKVHFSVSGCIFVQTVKWDRRQQTTFLCLPMPKNLTFSYLVNLSPLPSLYYPCVQVSATSCHGTTWYTSSSCLCTETLVTWVSAGGSMVQHGMSTAKPFATGSFPTSTEEPQLWTLPTQGLFLSQYFCCRGWLKMNSPRVNGLSDLTLELNFKPRNVFMFLDWRSTFHVLEGRKQLLGIQTSSFK